MFLNCVKANTTTDNPQRVGSRSILHCDMNNFFASVECMLNPTLCHYPIAVCGSVEERHGIVLAKNYKAKAFKVQTGEAIWQAKQKCPNLIIVPPHYDEYVKYSKLARNIYLRYTDQVEPYGMDECWLDLTGTENIFGPPEDIAHQIRKSIKFELGLTISVGVSFNKIFAKLGSDMKKPDAVTVIRAATFKEQIWALPASDLLGVGRATKKVLDKYYIQTIGDLASAKSSFLQRRLGKAGLFLWKYANGLDMSQVINNGYESPVKSIGHGMTTVKDLLCPEQVWPVILELTQEISHKLRVNNKCSTSVAITVRDNTLLIRQWQIPLPLPTQSPMIIARTAFQLFSARYKWEMPIRSITIRAIKLVSQDNPLQLDMFTNAEKIDNLDACVDNIRTRFGDKIIRNAILFADTGLPQTNINITMPSGLANQR